MEKKDTAYKMNEVTDDPILNLVGAIIKDGIDRNDEKFFDSEWGNFLCKNIGVSTDVAKRVIKDKKATEFIITDKRSNRRPVICLETGVVYSSAAIAGKVFKTEDANITACCKRKGGTCKGYHFEYYEKPLI